MSQMGELMALFMQESDQDTTRSTRRTTIVEFLRETITMDGSDRLRRRKSIREHLGLKNIVCCVSPFGHGSSNLSTRAVDEGDEVIIASSVPQQIDVTVTPSHTNSNPECIPPSPRMNLADALAAERYFRSTSLTADQDVMPMSGDNVLSVYNTLRISTSEGGTPLRVSLMRLLEEMDGQDDGKEISMGEDAMCCVCMGRKKGAAFIPCGHTFCRVCSRELWMNLGNCPLCNRSILEILDIY